ncbi:peptidase S33 proline iminopeptidase family protein [Nitzschia inconspicua]|uniref:Peptidase S33 proline iminopeptidase family protein n=1 Tax=Nitzschia inconspicua TaxID=303405 RepID=A0A9K3LTW6_9STRA|nr:peptidase S33 proline iminopeptidase family protein [Nitzschia inconspicua]
MTNNNPVHEEQPLLIERRESQFDHDEDDDDNNNNNNNKQNQTKTQCYCFRRGRRKWLAAAVLNLFVAIVLALLVRRALKPSKDDDVGVIDIFHATEYRIPVEEGITLWCRTWGNVSAPAVLFVHGGPGGAVEDYHNGNQRFFEKSKLFVVEVDQRGTGRSQPNLRDDFGYRTLYQNISIETISNDYEIVREFLNIDQWVVWGGSYGSTIGIDYAMRYPKSTLALILRGVYLNTITEMDEVYSQNAFLDDPKKLSDFRQLYGFAVQHASIEGRELDSNDSFGLTKEYEKMIDNGNEMAVWQWFVFENNLMEEDPQNLLDPNRIDESRLGEAQSTAFLRLDYGFTRHGRILATFSGELIICPILPYGFVKDCETMFAPHKMLNTWSLRCAIPLGPHQYTIDSLNLATKIQIP